VPSRPLSADRTLEVRLHSRVGTAASAVGHGRTTPGHAVAALSFLVPCRPDVVRTVLTRVRSVPSQPVEWPPLPVQVDLLDSLVRVTLGHVRLTGPGGVTVEHVTYTDKLGYTRRVLRLRRHGVFVGDYRTVEDLGREVDLATLRESEE
jgi:hypothetical protein